MPSVLRPRHRGRRTVITRLTLRPFERRPHEVLGVLLKDVIDLVQDGVHVVRERLLALLEVLGDLRSSACSSVSSV